MSKISNIINFIASLIILTILIYIQTLATPITKIVLQPFIICALAFVGKSIVIFLNKQEYLPIFNKIYVLSFLIYWFGILIFWCYEVIKSHEYLALLFSLPFWICGLFILYRTFIKKSKIR